MTKPIGASECINSRFNETHSKNGSLAAYEKQALGLD